MPNKVLAGISLAVSLIALVLTCYSFHAEKWVTFEDTLEEDRDFGLFT